MDPTQHPLFPDHMSLWQMLWASPMVLLGLFVKGVREWVKEGVLGWFKRERREEVVTRTDFEARHSELRDDLARIEKTFSETLQAHAAQARVDNRDLKAELKTDISEIKTEVKENSRDLFQKMDNFLAMVSMRIKP